MLPHRALLFIFVGGLAGNAVGCSAFEAEPLYIIAAVDRTIAKLDRADMHFGTGNWSLGPGSMGFNKKPPPTVTIDWKIKDGRSFQKILPFAARLPSNLQGVHIFFVFDDDGTVRITWATRDDVYGPQQRGMPIEALIEKKLGPAPRRDRRDTELLVAARQGDLARVSDLLNQGVDVNAQDYQEKRTALESAAALNKYDVALLLLQHKARGGVAMALAASTADTRMLELLRSHDADINAADQQVGTPLVNAIDGACGPVGTPALKANAQRCAENARWLIDHGADVNKPNPNTGRTPVFVAAYGGQKDLLALLLQRKANPNIPIQGGPTALVAITERARDQSGDPSVRQRDNEIINMLRAAGAKP